MRDDLQQAKEVAFAAVKDASANSFLHWAAAIAFYAILSFAPLVFIVISITSYFVDSSWAAERMSQLLGNFLPDESEQQVTEFVDTAHNARGRVGLISFVAFIYTGTRVFGAFARALAVIYEREGEERNPVREFATQLIMLFTLGGVFLAALTSSYFFGLLFGADSGDRIVARLISGALQIVLLLVAITLIYRYVPRRDGGWRPALIGAAVATALFVLVRPLFLFYLDRTDQQEVIYGSLATLVVLLLWIWIIALIVLFGAAVAANCRDGAPGSTLGRAVKAHLERAEHAVIDR